MLLNQQKSHYLCLRVKYKIQFQSLQKIKTKNQLLEIKYDIYNVTSVH